MVESMERLDRAMRVAIIWLTVLAFLGACALCRVVLLVGRLDWVLGGGGT